MPQSFQSRCWSRPNAELALDRRYLISVSRLACLFFHLIWLTGWVLAGFWYSHLPNVLNWQLYLLPHCVHKIASSRISCMYKDFDANVSTVCAETAVWHCFYLLVGKSWKWEIFIGSGPPVLNLSVKIGMSIFSSDLTYSLGTVRIHKIHFHQFISFTYSIKGSVETMFDSVEMEKDIYGAGGNSALYITVLKFLHCHQFISFTYSLLLLLHNHLLAVHSRRLLASVNKKILALYVTS